MLIQLSKDVDSILHIMLQAFEEYRTEEAPSSALYETADMITEQLHNGELALIGYVDGQEAAMVRFKVEDGFIYFHRLSVLPSFQGMGLAKELLTFLEQYAKEQLIPEIRCKVRMNVPRNMKLYQSIGYTITKEETVTSPIGFEMHVATMSKMISIH